jgi:hypothetical protein
MKFFFGFREFRNIKDGYGGPAGSWQAGVKMMYDSGGAEHPPGFFAILRLPLDPASPDMVNSDLVIPSIFAAFHLIFETNPLI